jgi:dihydrofolate synthase/folylpolyglutamate synthase
MSGGEGTRYRQAVEFLYSLRLFGAKFGLEKTLRLAALAGNPHERLRFIHVAGTNGKGSTCAMLENIYRHAGLRVGLFTSPHLVSFRERIQVNRQLIPEADVVRLVGELQPLLAQFQAQQHPTFFEVVTVMALHWFAEQRCELVVWETGLGGRLDATNIVTPLASVITNIGFDHQQWLGDTLPKIAAEKAGIIKPGVPVLTATDSREALEVIQTTAQRLDSPLVVVSSSHLLPLTTHLALPGTHQQSNAALAVATVETLRNVIPVGNEVIRAGLSTVQWTGRLQTVRTPRQQFILDGAHNVPGCDALARALPQVADGRKPALLLGMLADKDCAAMCGRLAPLVDRIALVPVASGRTSRPEDLKPACLAANPTATVTLHANAHEGLQSLASEPLVLVTGSLYLVGEALERLGVSTTSSDERGLNEWR